MLRVGLFVVCVTIFAMGCWPSPKPTTTEASPDPKAVSPGELLELYQAATAAHDAGEVARKRCLARTCRIVAALINS
jgi:hypothetical protein